MYTTNILSGKMQLILNRNRLSERVKTKVRWGYRVKLSIRMSGRLGLKKHSHLLMCGQLSNLWSWSLTPLYQLATLFSKNMCSVHKADMPKPYSHIFIIADKKKVSVMSQACIDKLKCGRLISNCSLQYCLIKVKSIFLKTYQKWAVFRHQGFAEWVQTEVHLFSQRHQHFWGNPGTEITLKLLSSWSKTW